MVNRINFSKFFKIANIFSLLAIFISILFLFLKGLNFGVDFKGGTLLEIRVSDSNVKIQDIRDSLKTVNVGDVSVKEFGKDGDFLVKFEKNSNENDKNPGPIINSLVTKEIMNLRIPVMIVPGNLSKDHIQQIT